MHALLYRGDDLVREIYDITFTRQPFLMMERDGTIHQAHALEYRGFYPWCRTFALDTWVLANWSVGGHVKPDNTEMLFVKPLRFHRRQLHVLRPASGGIRKPYGGTRSLGFARGSLVKHPKYGLTYVGGCGSAGISLHSLVGGKDGGRVCRNAKPTELVFLAYASWLTRS